MKLNLTKSLDAPKSLAFTEIDAGARRALERYRTAGDYAVAVYAQKRAELSMFEQGETASNKLVLLSAEADARGVSIKELASVWREKIDAEDNALPKIEAMRQTTKQAIREAQTPAAIETILANINWP